MNKKISQNIILASFLVLTCGLWLAWAVFVRLHGAENHENRELAAKPSLSAETYMEFAGDYEAYLNDNLPFRSALVSLESKIDFFVFDMSTSERVLKGKDGWLFYDETIADYERTNLYSPEELAATAEEIVKTKEYLEEQGIRFVLFIGPNKNSVYGDFMPEDIPEGAGESRTQQLVSYLRDNTDVEVIFPKDEMRAARAEHPDLQQFLKLDTHWNYMGGYFGVRPLLEQLGAPVVPFEDLTYEQVNESDFVWNGYDEAKLLGLEDVLDEDVNYHLHGGLLDTVVYEGDVAHVSEDFYGAIRTHSASPDPRKVFLLRDSFGEAITPYVAAAFPEVYSEHIFSFAKSHLAAEKPDVFLYEIVERNPFVGVSTWPE